MLDRAGDKITQTNIQTVLMTVYEIANKMSHVKTYTLKGEYKHKFNLLNRPEG